MQLLKNFVEKKIESGQFYVKMEYAYQLIRKWFFIFLIISIDCILIPPIYLSVTNDEAKFILPIKLL